MIMLINFKVGNYRSIKEPVTLSMEAVGIHELEDTNTFVALKKERLLKSNVIYGANASGKSNLVRAVSFMRYCLETMSTKLKPEEAIPIEPFLLSKSTATEPSFFEVEFIEKEKRYRYGFTLDANKIHAEWLFLTSGKEFPLFIRENENLTTVSPQFEEGKTWTKMTKKTNLRLRSNALFISSLGQLFEGAPDKELHSHNVREWFTKVLIIPGLFDEEAKGLTIKALREHNSFAELLNDFIPKLDLGINKIAPVFKEDNESGFEYQIQTEHLTEDNEKIFLDMEHNESEGTNKIFSISSLLLGVLAQGSILFFDEFDARLHPLLTRRLLELFHGTNTRNAQLVVVSHDTNLLSPKLLRRDQIWFAEKEKNGATKLTSLAEFKKIRKGESYERNYIDGRYGAIPYLGDFSPWEK